MFDMMYEEFYNSQTGKVERRKLTPEMVVELLDPKEPGRSKRSDLLDLNVVYKRQTTKSLLSIRLYSFLVDKKDKSGNSLYTVDGYPLKERVVKFQFESGQFDQSRQQGSRMTSQMKFNMDVEEFAYFSEIMKTGKIQNLIARNEKIAAEKGKRYPDPAFEIYKDVDGIGKRFNITRGSSADILIETSQEPSQKNPHNGQQINAVKIVHGLSLKEAGEIGAIGQLALQTLNMWYAFGKAEENLAIINARPKKAKDAANAGAYQNAQPRPQYSQDYDNRYAASGNQRGHDSSYAAQRGYDNGYAARGGYGQNPGYHDQPQAYGAASW